MTACYSSIVIILSGCQDWIENPVLMTVQTFDSPLPSIDFPSITLCTSPKFQPDNWTLTEQVFNSFEFNCKYGNGRCNQVRKDFKPFLSKIFYLLSEKFDDLEFEPTTLENIDLLSVALNPEIVDRLYCGISANKMNLAMIDDTIIESIGRKDVNFKNLFDDLAKGQLILKCLSGVIVATKTTMIFFKDFCPSLQKLVGFLVEKMTHKRHFKTN